MPKAAKSTRSSKRPRKARTRPPDGDRADGEGAAGDGAFADSLGRIFAFQRKVFNAGAAAARSAAEHPASKLVKDGMTDSVQSGLRKLESVFDDRVAAALVRMGMPSPEALRELIGKVDSLTSAPRRKPAKSRKGR
jgi:Poly(hydroxyalcanoate) granule associated protein (phasin)